MDEKIIYTLASVLIISLISFIGVFTLTFKKNKLRKILLFLISFSTGALLGGAFIHLLPEMIEDTGFTIVSSISILSGILLFFILEKIIHWRHCHIPTSHEHPHPLGIMNLVGDGLHNFIDGMIIAGSFLIDIQTGIATTIAVALHEIPQEIGDLGVLLHSGMSRAKALFFNFLSALTSVIGAIFVLIIGSKYESVIHFITPFTIGGFIYIAASDLIPELHKETEVKKSLMQLFGIVLGIGVMMSMLLLE
ncbi:ZIP family metal transporter [archaeon]|jgi:zinc and cadmium transporter|nr:ZIP family metal transporter [archaeon]MBT4648687.1 ZIP family metal transporter [archaeon]MBT6821811.1 ZIP family metal transporter [archaeon]MBT7393085.1 ZIP family metal transporter [archaeon]